MNLWTRFWDWYEGHITSSLLITAIIIYLQIPHMVWNADLYMQTGLISRHSPILDFLLYGIDMVEIIPMINIGMMIYSRLR